MMELREWVEIQGKVEKIWVGDDTINKRHTRIRYRQNKEEIQRKAQKRLDSVRTNSPYKIILSKVKVKLIAKDRC